LLLSATTKQADLAEIIEKYRIFDPGSLIFTKLDETQVYGNLVSELVRSASPLAFLTIGQNVPRDIVKPDSQRIVNLVIGYNRNKWEEFVGDLN
jgi:flagellar biosynthesis protein FlhF